MSIEINQRFVNLIYRLESENKITSRADAAKLLGYKPQAFNEVLKGRTNVGVDIIHNFCTKYKVSPTYIILGVGDPFSELDPKLSEPDIMSYLRQKDEQIKNLNEEIGSLKNQISALKKDAQTPI